MRMRSAQLPKPYPDAVLRWRDYDFLMESWDRHFPTDRRFELCAYRELGVCSEIECGAMAGQPKFTRAADMEPEQAGHVLGIIRAQASTEFGSIQQHRGVLARVLRVAGAVEVAGKERELGKGPASL